MRGESRLNQLGQQQHVLLAILESFMTLVYKLFGNVMKDTFEHTRSQESVYHKKVVGP